MLFRSIEKISDPNWSDNFSKFTDGLDRATSQASHDKETKDGDCNICKMNYDDKDDDFTYEDAKERGFLEDRDLDDEQGDIFHI